MPINSIGQETSLFKIHETKFEIAAKLVRIHCLTIFIYFIQFSRYKILDPIGQGAYGVVCAAIDMTNGSQCAIKKIENAFEHITFTRRTLRELRILRNLVHENVIDIKEIFIPDKKSEFQDIYVINELMETDLASILKSGQNISDDHCQFFLYQILRGYKLSPPFHLIRPQVRSLS